MLPPRRTRCQLRVRAQPSLQFRKSIAFYSRRHPAATNYPLLCIWRGAVNSTARARAPMRRPGCNRINRRRGATFSRQSRLLTRRLPSAHARARRHPGAKGPGQSLLPPPWEHALGRIATTVVSTGAACIAALASEFCVVARRHHGVLSAAQVQTSCPGARAPATCGYIQQCVVSSPAHWWKLSVRQGVPDPAQATRGRQLPMPS